jgi:hypothetical protein
MNMVIKDSFKSNMLWTLTCIWHKLFFLIYNCGNNYITSRVKLSEKEKIWKIKK